MSEFASELARLMAARGLGVRELARTVPCNPGHISNLRTGKARPSPELAKTLDERLAAGGSLRALAPDRPPGRPQLTPALDDSAVADEIAALDLVRQAEASQVGSGTVERLELAVDDLATAYPGTPAAVCWTGCAGISVTSPGCSTPKRRWLSTVAWVAPGPGSATPARPAPRLVASRR
jgi:transcriptional regulator with XRE-family HTH domain